MWDGMWGGMECGVGWNVGWDGMWGGMECGVGWNVGWDGMQGGMECGVRQNGGGMISYLKSDLIKQCCKPEMSWSHNYIL